MRSKAVSIAIAVNWLTNVSPPDMLVTHSFLIRLYTIVHSRPRHSSNVKFHYFWYFLLLSRILRDSILLGLILRP